MTERKSLSKKTRFEVFKRDSFTCQYCGKSAPDVILQVDHIMPISKGGDDDITNLITSCESCNQGKRDILLDDDTVIAKRKKQLDKLQMRREQIEMMYEWQLGLASLENDQIDAVDKLFSELAPGYSINDSGKQSIKKIVGKYGLCEVLESLRISARQYLVLEDGKHTEESVHKVYDYIEKICKNRKRIEEKPYLANIYKIANILKYKFRYFNQWQIVGLIEKTYFAGGDFEDLEFIARHARNYSMWERLMNNYSEELKNNGE